MPQTAIILELIKIIIQLATVTIAVWGGLSALIEYRERSRTSKALKLNEIVNQMRNDDDMREVMHLIEWKKFRFDSSFYTEGLEKKADRTFEYLSYFCYLLDSGIIGEREFAFIEYEVITVLKNYQVQSYFFNLYHYIQHEQRKIDNVYNSPSDSTKIPFYYLLEYGIKKGVIDSDLYSFDNPKFKYIIEDIVL